MRKNLREIDLDKETFRIHQIDHTALRIKAAPVAHRVLSYDEVSQRLQSRAR